MKLSYCKMNFYKGVSLDSRLGAALEETYYICIKKLCCYNCLDI